MLRTSSYVIYVPVSDQADAKSTLLVHGYTGAYDRVSKKVVSYLKSYEASQAPPLHGEWVEDSSSLSTYKEALDEETISRLKERGYLTSMTPEQEVEVFRRFAIKIHEKRSKWPAYILMPTYNCNLRCSYCFQDHMRTNPFNGHLLRLMSWPIVDRVFLAMSEIEGLHGLEAGTHRRSITLFGGEPLLAASHATIDYILKKADECGGADFSAITNATEIDSYAGLLGPGKIARLQITLDGPPAEHDKRRIYPDGSGSFAKIADNITLALDRGTQISVRLNLDRQNIEDVPELARAMRQHGWFNYTNFSVYTAPIVATNGKTEKSTTFGSWQLDYALTKMRKSNEDLIHIARPDDGVISAARSIFSGDLNAQGPSYKAEFCSAHSGMYIFDAFADIYACWERTGDATTRIGHINEGGSVDLHIAASKEWRTRTVASNPVCSKCRYALHCGGGCAILAQQSNGTYHSNYCDGYASRFKASVAEAYADHLDGRSITRTTRVCDQ